MKRLMYRLRCSSNINTSINLIPKRDHGKFKVECSRGGVGWVEQFEEEKGRVIRERASKAN